MPNADDYVPPTRERLVELAEQLYELGRIDESFNVRSSEVALTQVPAAFATARYAIDAGKAAVDLHMSGGELVSLTLVRACFESAITALWLVQSEEAVLGFVGEEYRQRRLISKSMAQSTMPVFRDGAGGVMHLQDEAVDTVAKHQAQYFERRCLALKGGHDAYLYYRILSGMCHPSSTLADFYLVEDPESLSGCQLHMRAEPVGYDTWAYLAIASMMWAHRALDHLNTNKTYRSRLREIANELGVAQTLTLTEEARADIIKSKQARRRASWKGRRPKSG